MSQDQNAAPGAITPNLIVEDIEANLPFWIDRLGFEKTVEVLHEGRLGFVILVATPAAGPPVRVMLQSRASLRDDVGPLADGAYRAVLYIEVPSLAPWRVRLGDLPHVVPERTTFYGTKEIIVRDPAGNALFFSEHAH